MGAPDLPPLRLRPYLSYAHSLYERGNAAGALAVLEIAIVRWPNSADLHMLVGTCHQSLEDWESALLAFQRSNLSEPRPYVCVLLASSLDKLGRRGEARHSLVVDPNYEESHYNLGYVLEREGAREHYCRAIELDPDYALAKARLATLQAGMPSSD
jgi:tetratricopeptide (TPR) repeat protein